LTSGDAATADLLRWARTAGALALTPSRGVTGSTESGSGTWVFDTVEARGDACLQTVRVTALVGADERIAAAYWSLSYPTQDAQDAVKYAGQLQPGVELPESDIGDAAPLVDALVNALRDPSLLPGLYSQDETHVTIGSVVDEVFVGEAGHAAWSEFVKYVSAFKQRGPMRAGLVGADAGWVAANIDIGEPPTPYRFFYVWVLAADGWKIAVSHDSVSIDPLG
jgi:hypothetical protein